VLVVGACGSGKTRLARALAGRLGLPCVELDALHHGPNWTTRPSFAADLDAATRADAWVVDGNYSAHRDLMWSRADTVVWLDLPLVVVEWQVMSRSFVRWLMREKLWAGNVEPSPLGWLNPEHPIRWAWRKHAEYRETYEARFAEARWTQLERVRLRSRGDVRAWLGRAGGP
jgi:adenylate kinase family enzyme